MRMSCRLAFSRGMIGRGAKFSSNTCVIRTFLLLADYTRLVPIEESPDLDRDTPVHACAAKVRRRRDNDIDSQRVNGPACLSRSKNRSLNDSNAHVHQ